MSEELYNFLNGTAPLNGYWFGEDHPNGNYWWRSMLEKETVELLALRKEVEHLKQETIVAWENSRTSRAIADNQTSRAETAEAEVARLREMVDEAKLCLTGILNQPERASLYAPQGLKRIDALADHSVE